MNDSSRQSTGTSETIFGRLWLVRDVAALGEWILFIGFIAYLGVFTDSPRTITILVLTQLVPPFLLGPVVRRVITWRNAVAFGITAYLMRATILLPLFLIQREEGVQPILVIATIAAVTSTFSSASQAALLGAAIPRPRRNEVARALFYTSLLAATVGPALGLVVNGVAGLQSIGIASMVTALVAGALLFTAREVSPQDETGTAPLEPPAAFGPLPVGIVEAFRSPGLQQVAATQVLAALLAGGLVVVQVAFMTTGLTVGIENVAVVLAGQGFGALIGAFGYSRFGSRYTLSDLVATGLALMGAGEFGLAVSSSVPAGAAMAGVIGLGAGLLAASLSEWGSRTLRIDESRPPRFGVSMAVQSAAILSTQAAGPLCESISARFTLVLSGILLSTLALYAFGALPENAVPESEPSQRAGATLR
jgi:hypothetical protein